MCSKVTTCLRLTPGFLGLTPRKYRSGQDLSSSPHVRQVTIVPPSPVGPLHGRIETSCPAASRCETNLALIARYCVSGTKTAGHKGGLGVPRRKSPSTNGSRRGPAAGLGSSLGTSAGRKFRRYRRDERRALSRACQAERRADVMGPSSRSGNRGGHGFDSNGFADTPVVVLCRVPFSSLHGGDPIQGPLSDGCELSMPPSRSVPEAGRLGKPVHDGDTGNHSEHPKHRVRVFAGQNHHQHSNRKEGREHCSDGRS